MNMSEFQFITSDRPLREVDNPFVSFLSIREALAHGIALPDMLLEDDTIDRDAKLLMHVEDESRLDEIEIKHDLSYEADNVEAYSNEPYVAELRWRLSEARTTQLIAYVEAQLEEATVVELWKVWVDEVTEPIVHSISSADLSPKALHFLGEVGFERPECLRIVKTQET